MQGIEVLNNVWLEFLLLCMCLVVLQVLQRQMDLELDLVSDVKEPKSHNNVVARVSVHSLNSQPVDHEESNKHTQHSG